MNSTEDELKPTCGMIFNSFEHKCRRPPDHSGPHQTWDDLPKRGGRRPGSGRKPLGNVALTRIAVFLSTEQITKAAQIGDGNVSAGVRKAIDSTPA